ncbi:MAG: sigma-70 family RNA polymerase sigma factor [Planctomycetota bacterium]|nr:sigma-70 family RNA polymerase sigma factor [Planctomycetota bacterium]
MVERSSKVVAGVGIGSNRADAAGAFEDAALLAQCRKGDADAFGPLVNKYQDRLFNSLLRFCGNYDDAEELCQETFVKAIEGLSSFRRESGFYTWLFRIGMNLAISRRRRGGMVKFHSLEATDSTSEQLLWPRDVLADCRETDPQDTAEQSDTNRRVLAAMRELDEEFRIVVVLRDVEEMNYEQISQVLSLPTGTVKSRLYRARRILKEKLTDLVAK